MFEFIKRLSPGYRRRERESDGLAALLALAFISADTDVPDEPKQLASPGERVCDKCRGTEYTIYYRSDWRYYRQDCRKLECPDHEHLHVKCCNCQHVRWEHCADHIEEEKT